MSVIISTGSNLGNRLAYLSEAKERLNKQLQFIAESRVYESDAVDYENQPAFLNQVLEFQVPYDQGPREILKLLLSIEKDMGRIRDIPKGPRTIDLDLLFWKTDQLSLPELDLPHPRLFTRSFIVLPLMELPYAATLKRFFTIPDEFSNTAKPL